MTHETYTDDCLVRSRRTGLPGHPIEFLVGAAGNIALAVSVRVGWDTARSVSGPLLSQLGHDIMSATRTLWGPSAMERVVSSLDSLRVDKCPTLALKIAAFAPFGRECDVFSAGSVGVAKWNSTRRDFKSVGADLGSQHSRSILNEVVWKDGQRLHGSERSRDYDPSMAPMFAPFRERWELTPGDHIYLVSGARKVWFSRISEATTKLGDFITPDELVVAGFIYCCCRIEADGSATWA